MSYRNCFENNRPVTINSMFNECSAVHLHSNALQVIRVRGAAAPTSFNSNYLFSLKFTDEQFCGSFPTVKTTKFICRKNCLMYGIILTYTGSVRNVRNDVYLYICIYIHLSIYLSIYIYIYIYICIYM